MGCRVVVKEAWPESRRRPSGTLAQLLHHGGQLAAVEVCIDSFAGWEELTMNESRFVVVNEVSCINEGSVSD